MPFGASSSIVLGTDPTTSNLVDVLCTGGTTGSKVRLRRQLNSAEMTAEGTNGNRIAIHAIAIMVDTCSQCNDIRYVLPKIRGYSYHVLLGDYSGFTMHARMNPTICRNYDVYTCSSLNTPYLGQPNAAGAVSVLDSNGVLAPYVTLEFAPGNSWTTQTVGTGYLGSIKPYDQSGTAVTFAFRIRTNSCDMSSITPGFTPGFQDMIGLIGGGTVSQAVPSVQLYHNCNAQIFEITFSLDPSLPTNLLNFSN